MSVSYITRQQKAVLDGIAQHGHKCLSAAELTELLHQSSQDIGLTTVYRQLEKLVLKGLVHKIITEDGAYYQYCEKHGENCFLLRCEQCGNVEHIDCSHLTDLYLHLLDEHHFTINPRKTMLYGLCNTCVEGKH